MHSPPHGSLLHFTIHLSFSAFHLIFQLLNLLGQFLCLFGFLLRFFLCLIQNPKAAWTSSAVTPTPLYRVFILYPTVSQLVNQTNHWVHLLGLFVDLLFVLTSRAVGSLFSLVNALILHWFNPVPPKTGPSSLDLESSDSDEVLIFNAFPGTKPTSSFCCQAGAGVNAFLSAGFKLATTFKFCKLVRQDWTG